MNIYVSGANGYLGSSLVKLLSCHTDRFTVFALVRSTSKTDRLVSINNIRIVKIDIELEEIISKYRPFIVINAACLYGRNGETSEQILDANIVFPNRLMCLAEKYGAKAYINTGTSLPDGTSQYSLTKNTFVNLARMSLSNSRMKFINIRLEHFFGSDSDVSNFVKNVMLKCMAGDDLRLTEGTQKRDFIIY